MASNENAFQIEYIRSINRQGGFGIRIRLDYVGGVADLTCATPATGNVWVECKFEGKTIRNQKLKLTEQQRIFGRAVQRGGGQWCWLVCAKDGPTQWSLYGSTDTEAKSVMDGALLQIRKRGEEWRMNTLEMALGS